MWVNSYNVILALFGLVVGMILFGTITIAWSVKPRKTVPLGVQISFDGATHILPGEGHVCASDCMCHPRVDGLPGSEFVEHRPLRPVH